MVKLVLGVSVSITTDWLCLSLACVEEKRGGDCVDEVSVTVYTLIFKENRTEDASPTPLEWKNKN